MTGGIKLKKRIYILGIVTFLLDQIVKLAVIRLIPINSIIKVIPNFLYLTFTKNTGGAFSIFDSYPYLLVIVGIMFLFIFTYYISKREDVNTFEVLSFGFILGGIIGNLFDRIIRSGVVDFIGFIFGSYYFPIFNLADTFIVGGAILMVLDWFRGDINEFRSIRK